MQEEDCKLCKEHCLFTKDTNQVQDIRNMPKLEYPGSDQTCVGFCPASCTQVTKTDDCEARVQEYYKEISINNTIKGCFAGLAQQALWKKPDKKPWKIMQHKIIALYQLLANEGKELMFEDVNELKQYKEIKKMRDDRNNRKHREEIKDILDLLEDDV